METTPLERLKRKFADQYMADHPGVPRQEAKKRVTPRAELALVMVQTSTAAKNVVSSFSAMTPQVEAIAKRMNEVAKHLTYPRGEDG